MNRSLQIKDLITIGIFLCLFSLTSCLQKTVSSKQSNNNSSNSFNNQNPGPDDGRNGNNYDGSGSGDGQGYGDGTEQGIADAGQDIDYYTVQDITVKTPIQGDVYWSSLQNFPSQDRHIFNTDARFNLRVLARKGPNRGEVASDSSSCSNQDVNYAKLSMDVCVRAQGGNCIATTSFENIPIDQASKVKEFSVPVTSQPLVVEIKSVRWDYWCKLYKDMGYSESDPTVSAFCPTSALNQVDCVRFDFQFSTDDTKDVPGPRL
jgi:hypothetical protein